MTREQEATAESQDSWESGCRPVQVKDRGVRLTSGLGCASRTHPPCSREDGKASAELTTLNRLHCWLLASRVKNKNTWSLSKWLGNCGVFFLLKFYDGKLWKVPTFQFPGDYRFQLFQGCPEMLVLASDRVFTLLSSVFNWYLSKEFSLSRRKGVS